MRFIYITSKKFPGSTADHFFINEMVKVFSNILGKDFIFIDSDYLGLNIKHGRSLYYFIYLPFFIIKNKINKDEDFFFSNDPFLLIILIFWKKFLFFNFKIISEWHMLFDDWRDNFIARNSNKIITTTNHLKTLLIDKCDMDSNKVLPVYGGVDLERFDIIGNSVIDIENLRKTLSLPLGMFLVGYIGFYKTMGMEKGIKTMIEALTHISDKSVVMAFIGGKKGEIEEYTELASRLGVSDRVIFVPVVSTTQIPLYEKAMDILVIPYPNEPHFRDYGFPMKTYEYMATKKPIIYSDLTIIKEVLGDYAVPFIPSNPSDLANKILEVKNTDKKKLVEKAYNKVQDYSWKGRAERIMDFIKSK